MGGKTSTSWKPGQTGNPHGRPRPPVEERLPRSVVVQALSPREMPPGQLAPSGQSVRTPQEGGLLPRPRELPASLGRKADEKGVRKALWALAPAALVTLEWDMNGGGDKGHQAAKYVLDQTIGKPTETVRHTGEGAQVKVVIQRVDKQLVVRGGGGVDN